MEEKWRKMLLHWIRELLISDILVDDYHGVFHNTFDGLHNNDEQVYWLTEYNFRFKWVLLWDALRAWSWLFNWTRASILRQHQLLWSLSLHLLCTVPEWLSLPLNWPVHIALICCIVEFALVQLDIQILLLLPNSRVRILTDPSHATLSQVDLLNGLVNLESLSLSISRHSTLIAFIVRKHLGVNIYWSKDFTFLWRWFNESMLKVSLSLLSLSTQVLIKPTPS